MQNKLENEQKPLESLESNLEPISPINGYAARAMKTKSGKLTAMVYLPAKFKNYQKEYLEQIESQINTKDPYDFPLEVKLICYFGTKRRKDIQNMGKLELDILNEKVYTDDSLIQKVTIEKHFRKDRNNFV